MLQGCIERDKAAIFKVIILSIDDMGKFEEKEMKKIKQIKNTWYEWLIDYIPEPITKIADDFKDKFVSAFNTNAPKQTMYGRGKKLS